MLESILTYSTFLRMDIFEIQPLCTNSNVDILLLARRGQVWSVCGFFGLRVQDTGRSFVVVGISGRPNRMGPNSSRSSPQSREMASSVGKSSRNTKFCGRAMATRCTGGRGQACREPPFEPRRGVGSCKSNSGSPRDSVGSTGGIRFCRSPYILKQARRSAQEQPISAQIKDTEDFIARSTHRLQVLAQKRNEEEQLLENAKARLERLRSSVPPVPQPSDLDVQVDELKAKSAVAEAERDTRAREHAQRQPEFLQEADVEVNITQRIEVPNGRVIGKISFHIATRKCKSQGSANGDGSRRTSGSCEGLPLVDDS